MAGCRIVNAGMVTAVSTIADISGKYKSAGEAFIKDLNDAINEMEGAAKDALKNFIDTDVNQFVAVDLPTAVDGMSKLLEGNRDNFEKVDAQIAQSISGG
ncbi:hypothetical protein CLHUN_40830 [Ruminiclostridium hungatei]|uniref:Uncharacterized protein n=1 Tax=Ruminiclostridium hungatei TaxID=48256 RepID=A0A1V4SDY0_RUMHU|nr:hypothetical protein [Ruminiclostridium hungatei]OPX42024.1 hypothetical protein CLHUN_40830 [Ruminiclostridium hungatei]